MVLSEEIINLLRQKSGLQLTGSYDCVPLLQAIYAETQKMLGLSTLKRLLGFYTDSRNPHQSTLDIIAQYLGYRNWEYLEKRQAPYESFFASDLQHVDVSSLAEGAIVTICYHPSRRLVLRHLQGVECEVVKCVGSKLHIGDTVQIFEIVPGFPLLVKNVERKGKQLGAYATARENGVQKVEVSHPDDPDADSAE